MLDLIFALNVRLNIEMLWFERVKAVVKDLLEIFNTTLTTIATFEYNIFDTASAVTNWMEQYDLEIKWKHGIKFVNLLIVHRKILFSDLISILSFLFHAYRTFACTPLYELLELIIPKRSDWFYRVIWGQLGDNLTTWTSIMPIIVFHLSNDRIWTSNICIQRNRDSCDNCDKKGSKLKHYNVDHIKSIPY